MTFSAMRVATGMIVERARSYGSVPVFQTFSSATSAASSLTIGQPSGLVDDDLMVGIWAFDGSASITGTPSGWTELFSFDGSRPGWVGWKIADTEGASTYTVNISTGQGNAGAIHRISGANLTTPIHKTSTVAPASSTDIVCASVNPSIQPSLLLGLIQYDDGTSVINTYPAEMASIHNVRFNDSGAVGTGAAQEDRSDVAATGTRTFVLNNAEISRGYLIDIIPPRA